jgi:hypothetical protein
MEPRRRYNEKYRSVHNSNTTAASHYHYKKKKIMKTNSVAFSPQAKFSANFCG